MARYALEIVSLPPADLALTRPAVFALRRKGSAPTLVTIRIGPIPEDGPVDATDVTRFPDLWLAAVDAVLPALQATIEPPGPGGDALETFQLTVSYRAVELRVREQEVTWRGARPGATVATWEQ